MAATTGALMASAPTTASAYVQYRTSQNQLYSWREKSVSIEGYPHGLPLDKNNKPIVPLDNLGQPVPSCDDVSYPEADMNLRPTMYPSASPGDLEKRTLSDDDRAGLCAIYLVGTNPASCGGSNGGGCSIAATADDAEASEHRAGLRGSFWRWLVVGMAGAAGSFVLSRRRPRQTRRPPEGRSQG